MRTFVALAALMLALPAVAQRTIDFDVSTTTGNGQVVTTATWSTTPPAESCEATGAPGWTGPKAPSGSEELTLTQSVTLNLKCTWPGDSIATFSWVPPTTNTDGSPYTDPKETLIKYRIGQIAPNANSTCGSQGVVCVTAPHPQTMRTVTGITQVGTLRAIAQACNQRDVCSAASNVAMKTFTGIVTTEESIGIVVNPVPTAPAEFAIE